MLRSLLAILLLGLALQKDLPQQYLDIFDSLLRQGLSEKSVYEQFRVLRQQKSTGMTFSDDFSYFKFLPKYLGSPRQGESLDAPAPCFKNTSFKVSSNDKGEVLLDISLEDSSSLFCSDFYLFAYHGGYKLVEYVLHGNKQVVLPAPKNKATAYDLEQNGVRIFRFFHSMAATLEQVTATGALFVPVATQHVPSLVAKANLDFLKKLMNVEMKKRPITDVDIDPSLVHSGDFLGIIRLDGLDPMIAFGMGSTTGHTTVAQRIDGVLHICESQAKGSYWTTNGIQCTEFQEWMDRAKAASFQVVWAPLSEESRAKYDEEASLAFFRSQEGFNYGYPTLLTGWLDTFKDNLPCLPPSFEQCIEPELLDLLFTIVETFSQEATIVWKQAMGKRAGLNGSQYSISEAYHQAGLQGVKPTQLYQIPEQDHWTYNVTRHGVYQEGSSMVCCVFVCRMWKAAGLFGEHTNTTNCGEFTNPDVYKMAVFQQNVDRPEACKQADPENPLCQLRGDYTLRLDVGPGPESHFNNVPIHAHAAEHCPSQNPLYHQSPSC